MLGRVVRTNAVEVLFVEGDILRAPHHVRGSGTFLLHHYRGVDLNPKSSENVKFLFLH